MMDILNDKILYVGEHLSCNQYMHDITYGFSLRNIDAGISENVNRLEKNVVIFILAGNIEIRYDDNKGCFSKKGEIVFLPKGSKISYTTYKKVEAIFLTFDELLSGCDQNILESCSKVIDKVNFKFCPLKMRDPINHYCYTLKYCLARGVNCSHFHEIKHKEFFMYLRYFYTKEEIAGLLYPIIGIKSDFRQLILNNWKIGMSVDDIIDIMPMSKSTFIRSFDEYFNMTPYAWYQKLVCDKIVEQAIFPGTTTKDLMRIAKITDASQFNRFCRRNFDCTPKKLLERYGKLKDSLLK